MMLGIAQTLAHRVAVAAAAVVDIAVAVEAVVAAADIAEAANMLIVVSVVHRRLEIVEEQFAAEVIGNDIVVQEKRVFVAEGNCCCCRVVDQETGTNLELVLVDFVEQMPT